MISLSGAQMKARSLSIAQVGAHVSSVSDNEEITLGAALKNGRS